MIGAIATGTERRFEDWATRSSRELEQDPVAWLISVLRKVGALFLGLGVILGIVGYYLKAASVSAMKDEMALLTSVGQIWSNLKPITFQAGSIGSAPIFGANPLTDLENFANDAKTDLFAIGSDLSGVGQVLGTLGEDVGIGLVDLAKSIFTVGVHSPQLLWNSLVWVVGGGTADVINWLFPYLIIFGAIAVGVSIGLDVVRRGIRWYWSGVVAPSFNEAKAEWATRQRSQVWGPLSRRLFGLGPKPEPEAPSARAPPTIPPSDGQGVVPTPPGPSGALPVIPPVGQNAASSQTNAESTSETAHVPPEVVPPPEQSSGPPEVPSGPSREELETILGEAMNRQRDLIRAEQNAIETPTRGAVDRVSQAIEEEEAEEDELYSILAAPLVS